MSDLDAVLERLLFDTAFRAALSADPASALAGYQLSADDLELLGSQVSLGDGGGRTVETRTSKASLMGLFGGLGGAGGEAGPGVTHSGFSQVGHGGSGDSGVSGVSGDSAATAIGQAGSRIGESIHPGGAGLGEGGAGQGLSSMDQIAERLGPVVGTGHGGGMAEPLHIEHVPAEMTGGNGDHLAAGYHPHIDADGDGKWDKYVAIEHRDGSVDVYEDRNHDGIVDFVGHDRNGDGRIDSADYDENFDGVADTHMTDVNGDGWMDTRTPIPPPAG
jgi:hypothetical protein